MTANSQQITLPITGMTCANCAATIERTLKRLPTVQNANVNLASERASLEYDPSQLSQEEIVARIQRAGYDVALGEAVVPIKRFGDPPFAVNATATSGLAVSLSASGACKVSGNMVTLTSTGTCTIRASQAGSALYNPAPDVSRDVRSNYMTYLPVGQS